MVCLGLEGNLVFFNNSLVIKKRKQATGMYPSHINAREVLAPFRQHVRRLPVAKFVVPHWKHHLTLSLLVYVWLWLMSSLSLMIFLFSPTFLFFIEKAHVCPPLNYNLSYIIFFNLVFIFLFLIYFLGFFFVKVLFFSISSFNQSLFYFFLI